MKFRIIVKIGVAISVLLFCVAVGVYSFASLKEAGKGKDVDLFSMVPDDCHSILDTDNVGYFTNEFYRMAYAKHDSACYYSDVLVGFLSDFNELTALSPHGVANRISRVLVSVHDDGLSKGDVIAYFKTDEQGKKYLEELLYKKYDSNVVVKTEKYRGEKIDIYSLGKTSNFLSVYDGDGFLVVSYHKRLIDRVVDAAKDKKSIKHNAVFSKVNPQKSVNYVTLYEREPSFPMLATGKFDVWSEYELHMNTDVMYLSGSMYYTDEENGEIGRMLNGFDVVSNDSLLVVSGQEKVDSCISKVVLSPHDSIFDECVSNLSRDASYIMVVDMEKVKNNPLGYKGYIPGFILENIDFFSSFILSLQITEVDGRYSHIYVFTYKY